VIPNLAVQVNYSYTKTDDLFGNFNRPHHAARRRHARRLRAGIRLLRHACRTAPPTRPDLIPNAAKVAAGGNGFVTTNIPGYSTNFNGLELGLVKRLSNKWMSRVSFAWNNARDNYDSAAGIYDTNGNPTPTLSEPLKNGGQFAPQSGGSGSGSIYINASGSSTPTRSTRRRTASTSAATSSAVRATRTRCSVRARPRRWAATRPCRS